MVQFFANHYVAASGNGPEVGAVLI